MLSFRNVLPTDAAASAKLMTQLGYPTNEKQMLPRLLNLINKPDRSTIVAVEEGIVIGIIGMNISPYYEKDGLYGRIVALVVDEKARGKSVGRKLLEQAEQWFYENEAMNIVVNSGVQRTDTHLFMKNSATKIQVFDLLKA